MVLGRLKRLQKDTRVFFKIWKKTLVLMYHRVENTSIDPWKLSVSPENFEGHLKVLKSTGLVRPVYDLVRQYYSKNDLKPAIVITFDDGYEDNFIHAKPLLEKYGLPATFFITNKHIGQQKEFWWDELAHLTMETPLLPREIAFKYNGKLFSFDLKEEAMLSEEVLKLNKRWDGLNGSPTLRAELYLQLWKILSPMKYEDQQKLLDNFRNCIGMPSHHKVDNYCMSENQLISLAGNKLFTIGGHTDSHPLLPAHSYEFQENEIRLNKEYLENYVKYNINTFAYPSGKSNEDTIKALKRLGFEMGFNTLNKWVQKELDPFQISRFQVKNWSEMNFQKKLAYMLI
jgi:peptidoglycan/xylan/chitin deacetylase (PgdA/CDA1 family)